MASCMSGVRMAVGLVYALQIYTQRKRNIKHAICILETGGQTLSGTVQVWDDHYQTGP